MGGERRVFKLPGAGLLCGKCGAVLPRVYKTITTHGFITRERKCEQCGELNTTAERVIGTRVQPPRKVRINRDDYL